MWSTGSEHAMYQPVNQSFKSSSACISVSYVRCLSRAVEGISPVVFRHANVSQSVSINHNNTVVSEQTWPSMSEPVSLQDLCIAALARLLVSMPDFAWNLGT